jgi:hypothetical protein
MAEFVSIVVFMMIPLLVGVGGIGMSENMDWVKIKLAPRVYVVDYLRTELKK